MSVISCLTTDSYAPEVLDRVVATHFSAIDADKLVRPGMRVVLKPNLLRAVSPERATTTHPEVIAAVARWLRERGVDDIVLADSPGGLYNASRMHSLYNTCGLGGDGCGYTLNNDLTYGRVHIDGCRAFNIITPVIEADLVINLPKLKTHGMTVMSGAVKNLFGCVPGLQKPELHCLNSNPQTFATMLCELARTVAPAITLMDAVEAMEGDGPSGGTVCSPRLTLASCDIFALDRFCADKIIGVGADNVPMLSCESAPVRGEDSVTGDYALPDKPFKLPKSSRVDLMTPVPGKLRPAATGFLNRALVALPRVEKKKCIGCGRCAETCPQHTIQMNNGKAKIDHKHCISCFCCQEMCPQQAIKTVRALKL